MAGDLIITYIPQMDHLSPVGDELLEGTDNEAISHSHSGCPQRTPPDLSPGWIFVYVC